jgi:hypothetical protein
MLQMRRAHNKQQQCSAQRINEEKASQQPAGQQLNRQNGKGDRFPKKRTQKCRLKGQGYR